MSGSHLRLWCHTALAPERRPARLTSWHHRSSTRPTHGTADCTHGTHASTHTHTHTHTRLFLWIVGTFHRRNGFYTVQTVFSIALHLNLPLTGNWKFHSVWFISVLKYGDMGKCPHKSPSPCNTCHTHVIIQICVLMSQKHAHSTHTPATQPELFSARLELLLLYDYRLQHNALS